MRGGTHLDTIAKNEFRSIYDRNADTVYRTAYLHMKNKSDAEDAVQTVFMKYYVLNPEFANRNHEKAWFILTTRNHCRDLLRNWWNTGRSSFGNEEAYELFGSLPDGQVTAALLKLPDKYRELIYLYYYEEYSSKEIAEMTGLNESTLRTRLMRARNKLKKLIETEEKRYAGKKIFQRG